MSINITAFLLPFSWWVCIRAGGQAVALLPIAPPLGLLVQTWLLLLFLVLLYSTEEQPEVWHLCLQVEISLHSALLTLAAHVPAPSARSPKQSGWTGERQRRTFHSSSSVYLVDLCQVKRWQWGWGQWVTVSKSEYSSKIHHMRIVIYICCLLFGRWPIQMYLTAINHSE